MEIREYNKEQHMGCCIDKAYKMVTGTIHELYEHTERDQMLCPVEMDLLKDAVQTLAHLQAISATVEEQQEHHHG